MGNCWETYTEQGHIEREKKKDFFISSPFESTSKEKVSNVGSCFNDGSTNDSHKVLLNKEKLHLSLSKPITWNDFDETEVTKEIVHVTRGNIHVMDIVHPAYTTDVDQKPSKCVNVIIGHDDSVDLINKVSSLSILNV